MTFVSPPVPMHSKSTVLVLVDQNSDTTVVQISGLTEDIDKAHAKSVNVRHL